MKLAGQTFRSKASYQLGRIVKTSQLHIFITFNKVDDEYLKLTYDRFLELCYCSDEMKEEIIKRSERSKRGNAFPK